MDNLGYLLNKVSVMTKTELTNQLKEYKVTAQQWAVLKDISLHPTGTTPAMIAERLFADRPTVTGIIQRLLQKDWILTKHNPNDKRSHLVFLTDKANSLLNELEHISNDVIRISIKDIPKDEIEITIGVLQNMIQNLKLK
ncbi:MULTISPECIES: MarR family winged helix-turn-helix transcriptional regulator [Bacillus]|uniref:MarR family winged helix-turn-helix transcriptional regulator n=1 Tax=Bacillus TaxID=1386 RepID=UPI0001A0BC28|nr:MULTISPECIES: MarR family transcriptional regulator [Bacillus cereus group]EEL31436.1 Transcriptional regulator [Bacillus cereus Rock3-28]MBJ7949085.1 MarR family transcriptional regulator [Bacillus cereus group sp. N24]MCH5471028.1 MarR family transcriptional regulator [Bacillus toyonensis]MCU5490760.1 MarR family transcriptional regulator [Bacillus cereus]PDZ93627.1 MarR family transcriptional regulator [Bacillus thuringiensis]